MHAGSRVRVRFAGRLVDAYVLERRGQTDHDGPLAYVERAVGGEPVLTAETAALFRAVADRWAGQLRRRRPARRAARHAGRGAAHGAGRATADPARRRRPASAATGPARAFLAAVAGGRPARAVWSALPGEDWPARLAEAPRSPLAAGRGAIAGRARRPRPGPARRRA